jgi:hypothetical protein
MTPEGRVKNKVKAVLKKYGVWYHMPVPTGYEPKSIDFLCCARGHFFGIETKAPGKKPTDRQDRVLADIRAAGGWTFVIDGDTAELEAWLGSMAVLSQ